MEKQKERRMSNAHTFDGIRVGPAAWLLRSIFVPPSSHSEVKVAAIYRITREVHGHDSITCFLTNRSSTPVYISGKVFCSWEIQGEKADPTPNGGGGFWMNIRSSLPTYYCLNPLPRSAKDYAKWDGSLELNGLLPLDREIVNFTDPRIQLKLTIGVLRQIGNDPDWIDVWATPDSP